ncbi:iron-containing alcohol dehydrogenase [Clostridium sp. CCUG 7971]|uniref:iron-containing alcohol dehydrogenase n=1 Tax=Clostridium sp. CCUG 7971 TaxID=2811414 RepID=UPI001ABAACE4|nr:iron-containing alcohol dehydrogenase [Clostridium sp. CCUG 7971]MBO3443058.1 iron-containing alcohol dehydrogenase [Clostridium sp. CCUG 7971]
MNNFEWSFETKIIFGKDNENNIGDECIKYGNKILIVRSNGNHVESSGLMNKVKKSLTNNNIEFFELSGIVPNPTIDKVREGVKICLDENIDLVLAIGGGSIIDTAKAISAGVYYSGDVWDLFTQNIQIDKVLPLGVIPTIAASGSEGSIGAVITNPETNSKFDILSPLLRPKFAILNPELTLTLPKYHTFCGVVDILSHAIERYFTNTENVELTDRLGEALMKTVINNGLILVNDSTNYNARSEIMWASTLAHNGLLDTGRNSCWASHMIATELSAHYNAIHGATLSVIIPAWMEYIYKYDLKRFATFASEVFKVKYDENNLESTAKQGIYEIKEFFRKLNMPTTMKELGINDDSLFDKMSIQATRFGNIGCIKLLDSNDVKNIFNIAYK